MTIVEMIVSVGGIKEFSSKFGVPYRTVQDWHSLKRVPSSWLVSLFELSLFRNVNNPVSSFQLNEGLMHLRCLVNHHKSTSRILAAGGLSKEDSKKKKFLLSLSKNDIIEHVEKLF